MAKRTAKTEEVDKPPTKLPEIPEGDPVIPPPPDGVEVDEEEAAFSQLRYLFWTYLHWEVRNHLIHQIDVAPNPGRPIPQTIEMNALQTAHGAGRLRELWDLMQPYLPPARRSDNPFPQKFQNIKPSDVEHYSIEMSPKIPGRVRLEMVLVNGNRIELSGTPAIRTIKSLRAFGVEWI